MKPYLLDSSALIALVVAEHEHHARVSHWVVGQRHLLLCPIVEGALARFLVRVGEHPATVSATLRALRQHPDVAFLADTVSYAEVDMSRILGHRQVTDAYLVALAAAQGARVATLDEGMALLHPEQVLLLPAL